MMEGKMSTRRRILATGGAALPAAALALPAAARAAADATAHLPQAVVVGADEAGKSRISYHKQMHQEDLAVAALPFLAWDETPAAPNDGTYVVPLSERREPWPFEALFPTGSGIRVLYSVIAPGQTFNMHATPSLDIVFVLAGTVVLQTDEGETALRVGDVVVQNATRHNWRVPADSAPCTLGGVVLSPKFGVASGDAAATG